MESFSIDVKRFSMKTLDIYIKPGSGLHSEAGRIERHALAELCPVGALGFALYHYFRIAYTQFPNFSFDLDEPIWPYLLQMTL